MGWCGLFYGFGCVVSISSMFHSDLYKYFLYQMLLYQRPHLYL
jgi:hypothetical protein